MTGHTTLLDAEQGLSEVTQLVPLNQPLQVSTFKKSKKKGNQDQEASHHAAMVRQEQHFHIHRHEGRPYLLKLKIGKISRQKITPHEIAMKKQSAFHCRGLNKAHSS
jgi:hypothetical protein